MPALSASTSSSYASPAHPFRTRFRSLDCCTRSVRSSSLMYRRKCVSSRAYFFIIAGSGRILPLTLPRGTHRQSARWYCLSAITSQKRLSR